MKYLKKFSNTSEYESFKGGGEYITPNVSLIAGDNSVMFNPAPPPIIISTFKLRLITGTSYTEKETISFNFEVGMTIGEWVNSEYNVLVNGKKVTLDKSEGYLLYNNWRSMYINLQNELITENTYYSLDEPN